MKWKISKISSLTNYPFSLIEVYRNKKKILRRFIMGNFYTFPPFWTHAIFLRYYPGYFMTHEGALQNRIIWIFFLLLDERSFSPKVFMIIEIWREKWGEQKLGAEYSKPWQEYHITYWWVFGNRNTNSEPWLLVFYA